VAAWGLILEYHSQYLALLAGAQLSRRLAVKADPLDLVQETMLQAHRKFHAFLGTTGEEFAAWLEAILASRIEKLVRRYYGTARRDLRLERELATGFAESSRLLGAVPVDPDGSPSRPVALRDEAIRVATAMRSLEEDHRTVLIHRHLDGLKFPEIADRMGRTTAAVTQLWVRAIRNLRGRLGEDR